MNHTYSISSSSCSCKHQSIILDQFYPLCIFLQLMVFFNISYRNIGVMFDHNLSMDQQITSVCKSAFFHISNIRKIRKYISQHAAEIIVHSLVTSRLDHCNALLCGVPKNPTARLPRIQNCAARLMVGSSKHDHIHPVLKSLHWLPVESTQAQGCERCSETKGCSCSKVFPWVTNVLFKISTEPFIGPCTFK